ncbi:PIN domain-containing protein [soil metagenome]
MDKRNVVDTGPIVAVLFADDQHHSWARETWSLLESPSWTCEPVLSEAQFIIRRLGGDPRAVLKMVQKGVLRIAFTVEGEVERLLELQRSYADVPMSLADACLVRMTELHDNVRVITTDSDFRLYRRNRRQVIPLLTPDGI